MPPFKLDPKPSSAIPDASKPVAPTPTQIEAESSGRTLRPVQDVVRDRRVPLHSPTMPYPTIASPPFPAKLG